MITESQFAKSAFTPGVEPSVIKAVAEVESNGEGFLPNGKVKILFEPHIFFKQLNNYDTKFQQAYDKFSKIIAIPVSN